MLHLFTGLELHTGLMLLIALIFVLVYEAINGFHDTANAVATVIYTRALSSQLAIAISGVCNFIGLLMGGLSVAYTIVHLLPPDVLLNVSSAHGLAMIFSMLLTAILWNFGTWYLGLPASSSHTLIGAIIGVGLTNAIVSNHSLIQALNITTLIELCLSLIISPVVGLILAGAMVFLLRRFKQKKCPYIHLTPVEREKKDGKHTPPVGIRIALIISAVGISFFHGANDGQKGIGLIMLMLIGIAPAGFLVNMNASSYDLSRTINAINNLQKYYTDHNTPLVNEHLTLQGTQLLNQGNAPLVVRKQYFSCDCSSYALMAIDQALLLLRNIKSYEQLNLEDRYQVRYLLICLAETANKLAQLPETSTLDKSCLSKLRQDLLYMVEYAPRWIVITVALALSLGTMIGWRRITKTIGQKIGKKELTYAQGLSAQMTAAVSIGIASYTGMLVSTTQIFSSAVTGTMLFDGGGVQVKTVKYILITWLLTLPVAIIMSSSLYLMTLKLI